MRRLGHTAGARVDLGKFLYIEVYIFLEECIGAFESSLPAETVTRCCIHTPSFAMTQKKKSAVEDPEKQLCLRKFTPSF